MKRYEYKYRQKTSIMAVITLSPKRAPLFFAFRIMVGCGFVMLFVFAAGLSYKMHVAVSSKSSFLEIH